MLKDHQYFTYILTNKGNTVLYVGITNNLEVRILQHKEKAVAGFTTTYNCNKLVYFEKYHMIQDAIDREKQLKAGSRQKKIDLIVANNHEWNDLSTGWYGETFRKST
jgi:putative endonuclease